jgi:uncharacterized membrane protein YgcG
VDPKVKGDYMKAVTARIKRLSKPLGIAPDIETLNDLKAYVNRILKLAMDRRIEPPELRAITDACELLRKVYQKSEMEKTLDELVERSRKQAEVLASLSKPGTV